MSEFAATYDAFAPRYDAWAGSVVPDLRADWVAKLDDLAEPGEKVVELGWPALTLGVAVGRVRGCVRGEAAVDA